ncbi:MAG: hypothetical protein JST88_10210, partial [Bacteroidetes bacterium]|nr:hypothetical protein [Bacteroidota bacterium]
MKQIRIILLISITLACGRGYAQIGNHIPQYAAYNHSLNFQFDTAYSSWASISGSIISRKSLVNAYIYPPGSFAAPAGKITHIYVAGNSTKNWNNPYFTPAVVCMGHTAIHDFDTLQNSVTGVKDTAAAKALLYSLQRVVITDSIFCIVPGSPPQTFPYPSFMYPADNAGIWIKIKLDQPFMYNPAKSLVVGGDINATYGNESIGGYMGDVRITVDSSPNHAGGANYILKHKHSLLLFRDTTTGKTRGLTLQTEYMDLGFD